MYFLFFYSPIYDAYCRKHYANGYCDYGCNNEECNWDGLDCDREPPSLAEGVISVVVRMDVQTFRSNVVAFLRDIGHELRTTLRVKQDELGNDMIYPWKREREHGLQTNIFGRPTTIYTNTQSGVIAYLEIDNRKCTVTQGAVCFPSANEAAEYLAATASKHSLSRNFPIEQVRGVVGPQGPEYPDAPTNYKYVFIGIVIVVLGGMLVGVLVTAQRKRAVGVTWFPEGFLRTNSGSGQRRRSRRRGPDGQEMRNLNKQPSVNCMDLDVGNGRAQQWSDDESDLPPSKRMRAIEPGYASDHTAITDYEETEPRMWTQQHLDAAEIRRPDAGVLTPPSLEHGQDVDPRGPCGMTPLMVAAVRGGGLDTGEEEDESDGTAAVIADLVAQGADLNATTDKSGETSLHLAARYARADAAKRLLDAGADANSQDNTGRTPLHSAVAADAMGVFQILLRNRATNLNARMHDGTTPLILAARLATEGMVEDLINADADINAADNSGKTALHWAAAVNNVDAVNILLVHGANRDAQDDKDETPLFLAAREGSFEACKALLDTFANREITDHMDRLPRDVASERLHHDIVRLLDEHVPRSPQMVNVIPNGPLMGSPNHPQLITHPTVIGSAPKQAKSKKRPKTGATGNPNSPESEAGVVVVRRKPSVKKPPAKRGAQPPNQEIPQGAEGAEGNLPSPYDSASLYSNALPLVSHTATAKQPPPYEDCIKGQSMQGLQQLGLDTFTTNYGLPNFHDQLLASHQRQAQGMVNTLSPPYSNQSPPHSVQSNMTLSPQASYMGSPSPAKSRPSLPTSPTHIAAMRQATHQKHGGMPPVGFDFENLPYSSSQQQQQQQQTQQYYQYLTPPSHHSGPDVTPQHLMQAPESFPTPSPDSPGHWSSSSPHSNSDWSECMASPNAYGAGANHQSNKGSEAIYI